ncbi:nitrate/nitrite transporter [Gilvibacter sp.]|uniref:nitrate/nitrite transporter n=1 Tax=Gilvibacter sp. TaxID=2729997 RepID=UPI0035BE8937
MLLLILAGEAVFILPFVLIRVFGKTFLDAFGITNFEIGAAQSIYGVVAFGAYVFGGPLADKYEARKLMAVSLWATALGGLYMATYPSISGLKILFGYWGFTTIFLFWAAMIKATRIWGGDKSQGRAFGILDGGRGLVGALFASMGIWILAAFSSADIQEISPAERQEVFSYVIYTTTAIVSVIGLLVWLFMKTGSDEQTTLNKISWPEIRSVLKIPAIWLLMIIILSAYVGYKLTDVFSRYARDVMAYNEVDAAKTGATLLYLRPITGLIFGFLADRNKVTLWLVISFVLSVFGASLFGFGFIEADSTYFFIMGVLLCATGIYGARALYFATLKESKVPVLLTGTAVGLISLIGYTPDIFTSPAMGYLIDNWPGAQGYRYVFLMLGGFATLGLIASTILYRINRK